MDGDDRIREYIRFSGGVRRSELARALGLPQPTVTSAVRRLLADGTLTESSAGASTGRGRPASRLRIAGARPVLGLVVWRDRTWISYGLDFEGHTVVRPEPIVPSVRDADDLVRTIQALADAIAGEDGELVAVVVSVPAPFLHGTGNPNDRLPRAHQQPGFAPVLAGNAEAELTERFGRPVLMDNDANLGALGERFRGAGTDNFIHIRITGLDIGSAVLLNGRLVRGAQGYAGELSHLQMDTDGPLCACGGRGCLRSQLQKLILDAAGHLFRTTPSFPVLGEFAARQDAGAIRLLRDAGRLIGQPLAHLATMLDPDRIVVEDSIGSAVPHIVAGIEESLAVYAPPAIASNVEVRIGDLGPRAELFGALELPREPARWGGR